MPRKPPKGKSLAEVNPELSKEWHPTKNGDLSPFDFSSGSNKKMWWNCKEGPDHVWETAIYERTRGRGCPFCSGHKTAESTSISATHPHLANEWHATKNGELTPKMLSIGSNQKVWWKCTKDADHEWETSPNHRKSGQGCAVCAGKKIVNSNSLASINPSLAGEWHSEKNGS